MTEQEGAALPDPATPGHYRIAVVCLGNICRSPMAHVVLEEALLQAGLADRVEVVSAGTADYHVGAPMDRRAAATLTTAGYDASRHRGQQMPATWPTEHDLVLAMDSNNLADILDVTDDEHVDRVRLFRDFDPRAVGPADVPDPYYGGDDGFEEVLAIVTRTSRELVDLLRSRLT